MGTRFILGLVLVALAGCGGEVVPGQDPNTRGHIDGAAGAVGSMTGAGGGTGAGGAGAIAMGGRDGGTGGTRAGAGGATGTGGAMFAAGGTTGAGGARMVYDSCDIYGWSNLSGSTCTQLSPQTGLYLTGSKDGRRCQTCGISPRPAGTPDCTRNATNDLCVLSCSECTFQ